MAIKITKNDLTLVSLQTILDEFSPHAKFKVIRNDAKGSAELRAQWCVKADAYITDEVIEDGRFDMIERTIKKTRDSVEQAIVEKAMQILVDRENPSMIGEQQFIQTRFAPEGIVIAHPRTLNEIAMRQTRLTPRTVPSIWGMGRAIGKGLNK